MGHFSERKDKMCKSPKWIYKKGFRKETTFRGKEGEYYEIGMYSNCGHCDECIADKSNNWVVRNYFESLSYQQKCFITLTYDKEHNPIILHRKDLTNFIKRLRYYLSKDNIKIRYYACGEYGTLHGRPHYHVIIYGWTPSDNEYFGISGRSNILFDSAFIKKIWGMGRITVQPFHQSEIAYISLYTTNKEKIRKTMVAKREKLKSYYEELYNHAKGKPSKQKQFTNRINELKSSVESEKQKYIAVKEFNSWSIATGWKNFKQDYINNKKQYVFNHAIGTAILKTPSPWLKKLANKENDQGAIEELKQREELAKKIDPLSPKIDTHVKEVNEYIRQKKDFKLTHTSL